MPGLFEPFRRGGRERTGARGSGLGLSIVRAVCDAHGGTVRVVAQQGGGLEVTVTLPSADQVPTGSSRARRTGNTPVLIGYNGLPAGRLPERIIRSARVRRGGAVDVHHDLSRALHRLPLTPHVRGASHCFGGRPVIVRIRNLSFDCRDTYALAGFWSAGLELLPPSRRTFPVTRKALLLPEGATPDMLFHGRPGGQAVTKNRLHVYLEPIDRTRDKEVERLLGRGCLHGRRPAARRTGRAGWFWPTRRGTSSACCAAPGSVSTPLWRTKHEYEIHNISIDCRDTYALAGFWAQVFECPGSPTTSPATRRRCSCPRVGRRCCSWRSRRARRSRTGCTSTWSRSTGPGPRRSSGWSGMGAALVRTSGGRTDVGWVVLADPEGNEFCVLGSAAERGGTSPAAVAEPA